MTSSYGSDVRAIFKSGIELIYYMRGSVSIDELYKLTPWEKEVMFEFIKEHIDREKDKAKNSSQPMIY